jgi:2,5-dihydroxypyridine 5,6-dioxygenase
MYARLLTNPAAAAELTGLFMRQLRACHLKPGELCVVVTDTTYNEILPAAALGAALELGAEAYQVTLPVTYPLPRKSLRGAWRDVDLLLVLTPQHRLHYRDEVREMLAAGGRFLMAVEPWHVIQRLTADDGVIRRTKAGARLLDAARTIRITSDAGTDLTMDKSGRRGLALYGVADEPGHLDFWGAGMVSAAQVEGSVEGTLVLDTGDVVFHLGRFVERPVTITFREGRAVRFEGGLDAMLLERFLGAYADPKAFLAGHMAWGTDHRAQWAAQAVQFAEPGAGGLDSESHYGNVQVELGSNNDVAFGGRNDTAAHLGLCLQHCSLSLDGQPIIERGEFVPRALRRVGVSGPRA